MPKRRPDHVPMRTCAVCRSVRPKRSMLRLVRAGDGSVAPDPTGKANGRGTYLCDDPSCREPDRMTGALQRALGATVTPMALEPEETHATT